MSTETTEKGFTQERLNDVSQGKISFSDLNPTERGQLEEYKRTGNIGFEEAAQTSENATPNTKEPEIDPEIKALQTKLFNKGVEANRNKQLFDNASERGKSLQSELDAFKNTELTKPTDDYFDDDTQKNLREELNLMKGQLNSVLKMHQSANDEVLANSQKQMQEIESERGSLSIQSLQRNFPDLATTVPVHKLDSELIRFSSEVGGMENVNKYLEDPEYKKLKDSEGVNPLSGAFMDNLNTFNKLVDLNHKFTVEKDDNGNSYKQRNADVSLENFYMNTLQSTGRFDEMLNNARLTGANSVIDKVVNQKHVAPIMNPSSGVDVPNEGMTVTQATEIVKRIAPKMQSGIKLDVEDQLSWDRCQEFIRSNYGNNRG